MHLLVHPHDPLGPQLPDTMLKLIPIPLLLLGKQPSRNETILAGKIQQDSQVVIELNGHSANISTVNNRSISQDIGLP